MKQKSINQSNQHKIREMRDEISTISFFNKTKTKQNLPSHSTTGNQKSKNWR